MSYRLLALAAYYGNDTIEYHKISVQQTLYSKH